MIKIMQKYMKLALKQAEKAAEKNEVPVGAVIVWNGTVISKAHNLRNKTNNAVNHAEVIAIQKACRKLKSWRLENTEIYVTLEPCPMCAGAIVNARIKKCFFGAYDKTSDSNLSEKIFSDNRLNFKTESFGGIMEEECSSLLTAFFKNKR